MNSRSASRSSRAGPGSSRGSSTRQPLPSNTHRAAQEWLRIKLCLHIRFNLPRCCRASQPERRSGGQPRHRGAAAGSPGIASGRAATSRVGAMASMFGVSEMNALQDLCRDDEDTALRPAQSAVVQRIGPNAVADDGGEDKENAPAPRDPKAIWADDEIPPEEALNFVDAADDKRKRAAFEMLYKQDVTTEDARPRGARRPSISAKPAPVRRSTWERRRTRAPRTATRSSTRSSSRATRTRSSTSTSRRRPSARRPTASSSPSTCPSPSTRTAAPPSGTTRRRSSPSSSPSTWTSGKRAPGVFCYAGGGVGSVRGWG